MSAPGSGKILLIRGGAIGDFVLTLPALRLIRESLPTAHIEVLGYRPMIDLAVLSGYADSVRSIEYAAMAGFFSQGSKLDEGLVDYFAGFSVVISYLFDPDGFFKGNLERAGVETFIECPYKIDEAGEHAALQLARPLENLALFVEDGVAVIPGEETERSLVAWHPGSGSPAKNWDLDKWLKVFNQLGIEELVLVSGEAEEGRIGEIEALVRAAGIGFRSAGCLGFEELITLLRQVKLFFGHDSGVSHLAAACGTPCALVFGPTDPNIWAPQSELVSVVRAPEGNLGKLDVEDVIELVRSGRLLSETWSKSGK